MTNEDLARQHGDAMFRIGAIYWLAVNNDGMRLPDELHHHFDASCWGQAFGNEMPGHIDTGEDLAQELMDRERWGLLACVDIQRPHALHGSTHGWGMYWTHWVYAETLDELYAKAVEVAKSKIDARIAELRAAEAVTP